MTEERTFPGSSCWDCGKYEIRLKEITKKGGYDKVDVIESYEAYVEVISFLLCFDDIDHIPLVVVMRSNLKSNRPITQDKVSVGNVKIQRSMEKRSLMKKLTPMKKLSTIKKKLNPMKNLRNVKRIKRCIKFIKIKIQQKEKP
ncbi:unnamed protein product [Lactuca saligna]|uniref:Uncharacterized protein n=1 Tax=Lactuca saligna TaxID=75948 RepID=A0AA35VB87_LACSI|nr:unnamed protein product [Lactuca saligna]